MFCNFYNDMKKTTRFFVLALSSFLFIFFSCSKEKLEKSLTPPHIENPGPNLDNSLHFVHTLDSYQPAKKEYNFYFAYKNKHPWFDAVYLGLDDAVLQYRKRGINIYIDYIAPDIISAEDQKAKVRQAAASGEYDVIGIDVAESNVMTPVINQLMDKGQKIMTFASSDAKKEDGCKRIAYVGNTHNYEDGVLLAEAFCQKINYKGKVVVLAGAEGAPCHEERVWGAKDFFARYPEIEVVGLEYDYDSLRLSYDFAKKYIDEVPDLKGFFCCNMTNPVGAARAVIDSKKTDSIVIVGMDHDEEALCYLRDGVIYALAIQDCLSIGFDTIGIAVKIADGLLPPDSFDELTNEVTTVIYQRDAESVLHKLFLDF